MSKIKSLIAVGLVAWLCSLCLSGCNSGGSKGGGGYERSVPITLLKLERKDFFERISLLGELRSLSDSTLKAETSGTLVEMMADVGDKVVDGQVLARMDRVEQSLALSEAESRLAQARSRLAELENGTRPEVVQQRKADKSFALAQQNLAASRLEQVQALAPELQKQVEGDFQKAKAAEHAAHDNYDRTEALVKEGALSQQELVKANDSWEQSKGELLRAERQRSVQKLNNEGDRAKAAAELESARAQSARAQAVLAEASRGPRPEVIQAQRELVSALAAARDRASLDLERTIVRAKGEQTIRRRVAAVGERLQAGDPIFELAGSRVEAHFDLPAKYMGRAQAGQTVLLRSGAETEIEASVLAVAGALDPESRRQAMRVSVPDGELLAGSSVSGVLLLPVGEGESLVVHRDALVQKPGGWQLFTLDDKEKAVSHKVRVLATSGEYAAIESSGLKDGDEVVGRGAPAMADGVKTMRPSPSPSPREKSS